jgi:hypothetical protein
VVEGASQQDTVIPDAVPYETPLTKNSIELDERTIASNRRAVPYDTETPSSKEFSSPVLV